MKMNKKGFTLLELLAVLVILAALATIAIPMFANNGAKSRYAAHKENMSRIFDAIQRYELENGQPAGTDADYYGEIVAGSGNAIKLITENFLNEYPNSPYLSVTGLTNYRYFVGKLSTGKTAVKLVAQNTNVAPTEATLLDASGNFKLGAGSDNREIPASLASMTADPAATTLISLSTY